MIKIYKKKINKIKINIKQKKIAVTDKGRKK